MTDQNTQAPRTAPGSPFIVSGTRRVLDLDAQRAEDDIAGYARVFGRDVAVHEADGATMRLLYQLEHDAVVAGEGLLALYDAVARHVPELTREEVDRLTTRQVGALLGLSQIKVREVEAQDPNGASPAATTTSPPG